MSCKTHPVTLVLQLKVQALLETPERTARIRRRKAPEMTVNHTVKPRIGDPTRGMAPVTMMRMTRAREEVIVIPKEREDNMGPALSIFLSNPPF